MAIKTAKQRSALAERLVESYLASREDVQLFHSQLLAAISTSSGLSPHVHSFKSRIKDPEHLREKMLRKMEECRRDDREFTITPENLLTEVNDLVGIRILHLYTRQIIEIDTALRKIFHDQSYELLEGPFARTWDDEYREFFESCGITPQGSPTMYTSVHYVVGSASRQTVTCEVQVRTLMEEVWGEVNHKINYPDASELLACREQLKVLARLTSSATRLVDSIFLTHEEGS